MKLWRYIGITAFWATWPLIWTYVRITAPRTKVLITAGSEILVVNVWLSPGTWLLPGGGIHRGEDPQSGALREVQEEVGLTLQPSDLQSYGIHSVVEAGGIRMRHHLYVAELNSKPKVIVAPHEIMNYIWLDVGTVAQNKRVSAIVKDALATWKKP